MHSVFPASGIGKWCLSLLLYASIGKIPCPAQSRLYKLGELAASASAEASVAAEQALWRAVFPWQQELLPVLKPHLFGKPGDSADCAFISGVARLWKRAIETPGNTVTENVSTGDKTSCRLFCEYLRSHPWSMMGVVGIRTACWVASGASFRWESVSLRGSSQVLRPSGGPPCAWSQESPNPSIVGRHRRNVVITAGSSGADWGKVCVAVAQLSITHAVPRFC
ncbi:hypothetical protein H920_01388 [Fukomys damarensis]|uniref:Uncharacterized protein n=1 Tax=Fukomys damarensis TaxID=885580 RepID=A0A091DYQ1_FUKDA|nr:hypothetical protein H920_01388 [Fukomys damarensis]